MVTCFFPPPVAGDADSTISLNQDLVVRPPHLFWVRVWTGVRVGWPHHPLVSESPQSTVTRPANLTKLTSAAKPEPEKSRGRSRLSIPFIGGGAGKVPFGERSRFHHCSWWLTRWLTRWPTRSTGFIIESYCDAPWMSLTLSGHSGLGVIRVICRMTQDTKVTSTQSANMFHPFAQVLG